MKKKAKIFSLLSAILIVVFAATPYSDKPMVDSRSIIAGLNKSINSIKTITYTMVYTERLDAGKLHTDSSFVKLQRSPHKIFMRMSDGAEVLWGDGMCNGNAWVHPNSFPYLTLELDPDGAIMRKNQHHGVKNAGYDYFEKVLERIAINVGKDFDSHFLYLGEIVFDGVRCYNLTVIDPSFKYVPYTVSKGENLISIAQKLWLNEYMIMQYNELNSYTDVNPGQTIMVPSNYGKQVTLYIDKATMLPLLLRVDDNKGLFEQYIFRHIKLNPPIAADEFTKEYKGYHF